MKEQISRSVAWALKRSKTIKNPKCIPKAATQVTEDLLQTHYVRRRPLPSGHKTPEND